MRISDWSSDVCSSDLFDGRSGGNEDRELLFKSLAARPPCGLARAVLNLTCRMHACRQRRGGPQTDIFFVAQVQSFALGVAAGVRSEERRVGKGGVRTWRFRGSQEP